jgi:hypothetical protein
MRTDKWLYFRNVTDVDDDDGAPGSDFNVATSLMVPASRVINMFPISDTLLRIYLKPIKDADSAGSRYKRSEAPDKNSVDIHVTANKHKEVMQSIISAINSPSRDSFIVIADDVVTDVDENTITAEVIDNRISQCGTVGVKMTPQGYGMHEYYEIVSPVAGTTDSTNDVVASLNVKLPAQCVLLEAGLITLTLADSDHGLIALEFHNAAIANDAASAGTEWLGANTVNLKTRGNDDYDGTAASVDNVSIPHADLDFSSNAIENDTIHTGVADPIDRSTAETFFHVTAKEDMASMTGKPRIGVYIRWFGGPAEALSQG